jgi:hypothetical protein
VLKKKIRTRRPHEHPRRKLVLPLWSVEAGLVFLFCCVFALLVIRFASVSSSTYDETTHLTSGYSYWKWDDYRMNPEHPPLVKKLAALPLLTKTAQPNSVDLQPGDEENRPMTTTERSMRRFWALGVQSIDQQWHFAHGFLYGPKAETQQRLRVMHHYHLPTTAELKPSDFINDGQDFLFWGRMPVMLLGCLLLALVYLWARQLFGIAGGVLAMTLICFDPNFIAHSGLVTTDVGVTLFMFGAMFFLWCAFRRLEIWSVALFLIFFGLAFATKFSAVLLVAFFWLVAIGRIFSAKEWVVGSKSDRALPTFVARAGVVFGLFAAACLTAWFVVWASYGFRFSAAKDPQRAARDEALVFAALNLPPAAAPKEKEQQPKPEAPTPETPQGSRAAETAAPQPLKNLPFHNPGHFPIEMVVRRTAATQKLLSSYPQGVPEVYIVDEMDRVQPGLIGSLILFANRAKLLPEAYLYGFAHARMKSLMRSAYLRGEYSVTGFRSYFLWTFLLKTPLPALLLMAAAIVLACVRRLPWRSRAAFLAVPVIIYMAVSITSNLNIGHRHLLPIYPFLFVLCGIVASEWSSWRTIPRRWTATVALLAIPLSCGFVFAPPWQPQKVHPHYLAYFNEFAGGPKAGYKSLVDSNLDWGQDLIGLKHWLEKANLKEPIILCYFGMSDPRFYGISHINAPGALGGYGYAPSPDPNEFLKSLKPGQYFAISATHRAGVYLPPQAREIWQALIKQSSYIDQIGYSIYIFRLEGSR